ncbi:acetyl-CoA carboxylase carboxyltransferase subunit alpha [Anaerobranca californiensis DSM 14826]|uniref:Acetyl-coenzyme A carboxylase carboxyl transferase subunit beta n=1 Tax=Anaerobranca californiensis DSM 14826 TaxID=1120989 RepID=A0A1M6PPK7_9FIRM|nr:acetyl-CoA carboxylase, carboxyltransferase subunit beta [Anaerobranca californiensis]SHK09896.1 acetyl-CoA carboxylase carboxyltransferase subunit alpha [Anaerobranca californiensis DSM 14826]
MLFKKTKYIAVDRVKTGEAANDVPKGIVIKCPQCQQVLFQRELMDNLKVCNKCNHHFPLTAKERIDLIVDHGTFEEWDREMESKDPLNFPEYKDKLEKSKATTNLKEAVVTGVGKINGQRAALAILDGSFMLGSMGSVVGEKVTRAMERAINQKIPMIAFTASGGARMQESILSLFQMAKTSAAVKKMDDEGILYITVLTDPTTGGVTASFASLGDIILAEPNALIAFAGPRVIEQTIRQKLPEGFQRAEFLLERGFIDKVVTRRELKETISKIIYLHSLKGVGKKW